MKQFKLFASMVLATCLLMTGCKDVTESNSSSMPNSSITQNSSDTNSSDSMIFSKPNASQLSNLNDSKNYAEIENLTETEQIFKVIKEYADFYYGMQPDGSAALEKITDKASKFTANERKYLKFKGAPADTVAQLNEKLDGLVTEKLKNEFVNFITQNDYTYRIKDGDIYITEEACASGMGAGMDKLYLNSIEHPDEKTILVNMTSFGDKTRWETEKDIEENFTVKLVRTDDGLRVAECDANAISYLYYYHEIHYRDISFSF